MKFEIPFDENIYNEQMKLQFDNVWSEGFKKNKSKLYIGIPFFLLGILAVYGNGNIGYVFIVLSLLFFYKYYEYYQYYHKNKKRYFFESEKFSLEQKEVQDISVWEFKDEYFRYKCFKCDYKLDWSLFTGFEIIDNNIFIKTKDVNHSYIVGKSELGESEFSKIIEFLTTKIKTSA
ncbi:hypothetical protein [Winogradskyella poriferorum]|uniref:YcxB-like protein domain-containing protein n=1 Tax=Winogradskyella poriferorum TaxID=307627 RepID=A0ABU7W428_9FLAO|tara:strand:- start:681 stop:1208 length:528 start_codon:yes stop_codon:yes gene_type:complete